MNNYSDWTKNLEKDLGRFAASLSKALPEGLSWTIFCSPISFRDPEADDIWHPYMQRKGALFFLLKQVPNFLRSLLKGIKRFIFFRFGNSVFSPNESSKSLAVGPRGVCKIKDGKVHTTYCSLEDVSKFSWMITDDGAKSTARKGVGRLSIILDYFRLLFSLIVVTFREIRDKNCNWLIASTLEVNWIVSLTWVGRKMFLSDCEELVEKGNFKKILCVQEMHPYARLVWIVAKKKNVPTYTIQHASITRTKLWYFPVKEEFDAGLILPDNFFVFSESEVELFNEHYYSNIKFPIACGPRFVHWKNVEFEKDRISSVKPRVLFATSLPWWDNEIVFQALAKMVKKDSSEVELFLRLHPTAVVPGKWNDWLSEKKKSGEVKISDGPLSEAVLNSDIIIGMNTTVLMEGLLMGKAALAVYNRDFLSFATSIIEKIDINELSVEKVIDVISEQDKVREKKIKDAQVALGINLPVSTIED